VTAEAKVMEGMGMAIARQWHGKHISRAEVETMVTGLLRGETQ
jgi:hypothetical protein